MSLYSTTTTIKKVFMWAGIIIGAIIFLNIFIGFIKLIIPKKQTPPSVSYGKLQAIPFPVNSGNQQISYTLDTLTGKTPVFADRVAVYPIQAPEPDLVALDNAKNLISKDQDFQQIDPTPITDVLFQWRNQTSPYKTLVYNILTHDFTLTSSYTTYPSVVSAANLGDQPTAITTTTSLLTTLNANFPDLDLTKTKTSLFSINAATAQLQPATSLSTSQIIQVDYYQNDINKISIYYPDPQHSLITALVGAGDTNQDVYEAHVSHQTIITDNQATYPIKTADQAWKDLQQGKAYIASYGDPQTSSINIRDISLGYYLGADPQSYLMPIVVFQGDNGFLAYVSAVTEAWIHK